MVGAQESRGVEKEVKSGRGGGVESNVGRESKSESEPGREDQRSEIRSEIEFRSETGDQRRDCFPQYKKESTTSEGVCYVRWEGIVWGSRCKHMGMDGDGVGDGDVEDGRRRCVGAL